METLICLSSCLPPLKLKEIIRNMWIMSKNRSFCISYVCEIGTFVGGTAEVCALGPWSFHWSRSDMTSSPNYVYYFNIILVLLELSLEDFLPQTGSWFKGQRFVPSS